MKLKLWLTLIVFVFLSAHLLTAQSAPTHSSSSHVAARKALAKLPLSFEAAATPGRFVARGGGYTLSLGAIDSYIALNDRESVGVKMLRYSLDNANRAAAAEGVEALPGVINYYRGSDPHAWRTGVRTFAKVRANAVYPGVDVLYYGDQRRLEFDFVVAPKSDPSVIALAFAGADKLFISPEGDLVAEAAGHQFRFARPYAYQSVAGQRTPVSVDYALDAQAKARLVVGAYDDARELVIDPVLTYSTFLGGTQADTANGIAVDAAGNAYVTGQTCSPDFVAPTPNPSGTAFMGVNGACDAYVTKLDPTGATLIYTTFIAGLLPDPPNATSSGNGIAVDATGQAYVIGTTNFWDLPLTSPNPVGRLSAYNGGDSDTFISILNADGTLLRETYLGGSNIDQGYGITVDRYLNVVAVGQTCSSDFPAYNSIQAKVEACVAFVTKLDYGLHISPPIIPGASPLSSRAASASDLCGYGAGCPAVPNPTTPYYFFSTLFGGQPVPPEPTWPGPPRGYNWMPGIAVVPGAITIGTPNCHVGDKPQILVAEGTGTSAADAGTGQLVWPCTGSYFKAGIMDAGGFVWLDIGEVPPAVTYATTEAYGVALDPVGDVFAVGGTNTADLTPYLFFWGYHGINYGKTGAWILKLSGLDGQQIYATSFGTEQTVDPGQSVNAAKGVAVDTSGRAYIVGTATGGMITTPGVTCSAPKGGQDAYVARLNLPASAFDFATYLGGKGNDQGLAIAIDTGGAAYITGSTTSTDLPVFNALLDANNNPITSLLGPQDVFIARLTPAGSALTMMAYLGGAALEQANGIALDQGNKGNIYIAGTTQSVDFPVVPASPPAPAVPGRTAYSGGTSDAFVAMINGASFPMAAVTPLAVNFGSQNVGTTSTAQTVTLQNTGAGVLTISGISFAGTGGDYSETNNCGTQLSPAGGAKASCTITITFAPTAGGSRSDLLQISDDSANSPQTVALTGTGVVVQGQIQLTPTTLAFVNQQTGTTSAARTVTVTNVSSTYALTISSITPTGAFQQTNNCPVSPATLAANANCTIQVTFAPTAVGDQPGSLTVTGAAANSPQSVALTGTGTTPGSSGSPDFTLTPSAQSISIPSAGGSGNFNISAAPLNGFNQALNFTCSAPSGAACNVSPTSLNMDGTSSPSVAVTVTITAGGGTPPRKTENRGGTTTFYASILPFGLVGIVMAGKKRRLMLLLLLVLIGTLLFSAGCGVNSPGSSITPGTYQVTVTGASSGTGAVSHSATVTLTVT